MNVDFPFHFDYRGRTAATDDDEHVRDMIEQFLFTSPGERVNRPEFGSGLTRAIFASASVDVAEALQFTIRSGLETWLGDLIEIQTLEVSAEESTLRVVIEYTVRRSGESRRETFERETGP